MAVVAKLYDSFLTNFGAGNYSLTSATQKVALLAATYTPNLATHEIYDNVSADEVTAGGYTAGGKTVDIVPALYDSTTGLYTARIGDVTWTGLTGDLRYAVVYDDSGTKPLLGYLDFGTTISRASADLTVTFPGGLVQMQRAA